MSPPLPPPSPPLPEPPELAERPSAFRRTVPSCMVASEGGSPVGDEPARTPRCAPSLARAVEKAKKLRDFPRGSRDDSARRRRAEEHDAYVKSVSVFLSRAIFCTKRRNRYDDFPSPRISRRVLGIVPGSRLKDPPDTPSQTLLDRGIGAEGFRPKPSPPSVSDPMRDRFERFFDFVSLENRDTGTRDACADDEVCFGKNGGD